MSVQQSYPEIVGRRSGYEIRFTCPACTAETVIVNKAPRDHFKETRIASCRKCKSRLTVLTPGSGY